jgi:hypothetical protein
MARLAALTLGRLGMGVVAGNQRNAGLLVGDDDRGGHHAPDS